MNFLWIISLIVILIQSVLTSELLFVYSHFRHGARGPSDNIKKDTQTDFLGYYWDTLGESTGSGLRMHFLLGYNFGLRYKDVLSKTYDPREILMISTPLNRTIQSAMAFSQGLYPPSTGLELSSGQETMSYPPFNKSDAIDSYITTMNKAALQSRISAIPIHLFDLSKHTFLLHEANYHGGGCPPVQAIRNKNGQKELIIKETLAFNNTYGEALMKYFKSTNSSLATEFPFVNRLCDHFTANYYEEHDMTNLTVVIPDITKFKEACAHILEVGMFEYILGDPDEQVAMMSMTYPLTDLLHYMRQRIDLAEKGSSKKLTYQAPRFVMISGHDSSVAAMETYLFKTFGTKIKNPIYAAHLHFELHRKTENMKNDISDYYVEYYIHDEYIKTFSFEEFESGIKKNFWSKNRIDKFCNFSAITKTEFIYLICTYCFAGIILILTITLIVICIKYKKLGFENNKKIDDDIANLSGAELKSTTF